MAGFYAARDNTMPPLPWPSIAPPFTYRAVHPDGYGDSRFCELYTRWEGRLSPVMRQRHPAGERLFVDYAGMTIDVVCPETGDVIVALFRRIVIGNTECFQRVFVVQFMILPG